MTACSTGSGTQKKRKIQYPTAEDAIAKFLELNKNGKMGNMDAYQCQKCQSWHLGGPRAGSCNHPMSEIETAIPVSAPSPSPFVGYLVHPYVFGGVCAMAGLAWGLIAGRKFRV